MSASLLDVQGLCLDFPGRGWSGRRDSQRALADVSFALGEGNSLAVVGESGSGKSTLAKVVLGLLAPSAGQVLWRGQPLTGPRGARNQQLRRQMQVVFQDPFGSLDPRMSVAATLGEAMDVSGETRDREQRGERIAEALVRVGLDPGLVRRYPHELSGGQCQRVALARAMIPQPRLLICDEATSALDVSVQAQIINLINEIKKSSGMALMFITHNLAVARLLCDELIVLRQGRVVEYGSLTEVYAQPQADYTRELLASAELTARTAPCG
jgi:peptide/nickel transport system ATP-binding protein